MAGRYRNELKRADATPREVFVNRRSLMAGMMGAGLAAGLGTRAEAVSPFSTDETLNSWEEVTQYNNFYEFGVKKTDPAENATALTTEPWTVRIDGMVDEPGDYSFADLMDGMEIEERIYRLRCVEAWSLVVPWMGFELADLLTRAGVRPDAKYIAFETLMRPDEMIGQRYPILDWPYREGLRIDEAMNPLTLMATGVYDKPMPNQNGAPIRLVVPWKYGFKSIKSIVRISAVAEQPVSTWNVSAPREYGFYANVNPQVDHPRWSQATERRVGGGLFSKRLDTQPFNGYGEYVADLYDGMDLTKDF